MNIRHGFTLVEILTVVVIIGILVTLVTVAVKGAMDATQRTKIATQMSQLEMALDHYKAEFGEYPPDMFDDDALVRHVKKRWPRMDFSLKPGGISNAEYIKGAINAGYGKNVDFAAPGSEIGALGFWLGGFPDFEEKLSGFSADPENPFFSNPFVDVRGRVYDKKNFIDMEVGEDKNMRLVDVGGGARAPVIGNDIRDVFMPVIYFRGKSSGGHEAYMISDSQHAKYKEIKQFDFSDTGLGVCVPYAEEKNGAVGEEVIKWKNPTTFQLLHPGLDGKFGEPAPGGTTGAPLRIIKTGENIGQQNLDNLTNFSGYKELKSILP